MRAAAMACSGVTVRKDRASRGAELGQAVLVGGDDGRDLGVAAGRLVVGKQHDRIAMARHLHRASDDRFRQHVEASRDGELGAAEPHSHAVIGIGDGVDAGQEALLGVTGEEAVLRTENDADILARPGADRQRQIAAAVRSGAESSITSVSPVAMLRPPKPLCGWVAVLPSQRLAGMVPASAR